MFAGNLRGVTQTLPLLIYQDFELGFDLSLAVSALLVVVSAAVLITVKLVWSRRGPDVSFFSSMSPRAGALTLRQQPPASW